MSQIPVIILSGFLGSGKTTLLKHVLRSLKEKDLSITLIMNEFGDTNIDGAILQDDISMKELLQGCLCCSIRDDLQATLKEISFLEKPDVVVVECTGLANPFEVIDAFIQPSLINAYKITKVISVVDGCEAAHRSFSPLIQDQMIYADMIILNKMDLITENELADVKDRIKEIIGPSIPVIAATHCQINLEEHLFLSEGQTEAEGKVHKGNHIPNHLESVHSFSYLFNQPISKERFAEWLSTLETNVLRMKGFIPFEDGLYLFQYTPSHASYDLIDWPVSEKKLVCIGTSLNKASLYDGLVGCTATKKNA